MDDVVVDFVGGIINAANIEHDAKIRREDIREWDLSKVLNPIIGGPWWEWMKREEWLWANFGVIPGAIGGIARLRKQGHYIELVTSKPEWAEHNVWKWLGKWRPAIQAVTIVTPKANKAHATEAEWLIDDKPENCIDFLHDGRSAMLFSQPHNAHVTIHKTLGTKYHRVNGWNEIVTHFTKDNANE